MKQLVNTPSQPDFATASAKPKLIRPVRTPGIPNELGERPQFRFGGKYLEKYGFAIGTPLTMQIEQNKIILTVEGDGSANQPSI